MVPRYYEGYGSTDCDLRGALVGAGLQPDHPVPPLPDLLLGEVPLVLRGKPRLVVSTSSVIVIFCEISLTALTLALVKVPGTRGASGWRAPGSRGRAPPGDT